MSFAAREALVRASETTRMMHAGDRDLRDAARGRSLAPRARAGLARVDSSRGGAL
jgi:hypothetical protein